MQRHRPVMLAILDGWGWREETADNAVRQAHTPNFDQLWATCPHAGQWTCVLNPRRLSKRMTCPFALRAAFMAFSRVGLIA